MVNMQEVDDCWQQFIWEADHMLFLSRDLHVLSIKNIILQEIVWEFIASIGSAPKGIPDLAKVAVRCLRDLQYPFGYEISNQVKGACKGLYNL